MRVLLCLLLAAVTAHAVPIATIEAEETTLNHPLSPQKLDAIRLIGRNVLQAKNITKQESSNQEQLNQLRATLDQLIAAEVPTPSPSTLSLSKTNKNFSVPRQTNLSPAQKAQRSRAFDEVSKLRQQAGHLRRQKNKTAQEEVYSSGFPVGEQHGRLYEELADRLESIVNNDSADRVTQLNSLRNRLILKKRRALDTTPTTETPTAQASPWKKPEQSTSKKQRINKSSH